MEQPTFNPHDEKFKKVADLPEEEQEKFVDVEGGFITKEAFELDEYYKKTATEDNDTNVPPVSERLLHPRPEIKNTDIAQRDAKISSDERIWKEKQEPKI